MNRREFLTYAGSAVAFSVPATSSVSAPSESAPFVTDLFTSGMDGVHTFRIPALIRAADGSLLVFCEARKESIKDASPTGMVLRRSVDNGRTWSPIQTIIQGVGKDAIMNPCPVVDRTSGCILLFCINAHKTIQGQHQQLLLTSKDHGATWTTPTDLANRIVGYDNSFVSGPGVSIQLNSGRLIVPGYTGTYKPETRTGLYSRVLYSDDNGEHWTLGAAVSEFSNECQAVELCDGRVMLNMRDNTGKSRRAVALSNDGGETWGKVYWDPALNECPCQASLIRYGFGEKDRKNQLIFANPDVSGARYGVVKRTRMTVRMSYDEGKTWPVKRMLHRGPSSYSSLARLENGNVGIVFEGGKEHRREWIRFMSFSPNWMTDTSD
jgi:sialidase-1